MQIGRRKGVEARKASDGSHKPGVYVCTDGWMEGPGSLEGFWTLTSYLASFIYASCYGWDFFYLLQDRGV